MDSNKQNSVNSARILKYVQFPPIHPVNTYLLGILYVRNGIHVEETVVYTAGLIPPC